MPTSPYTLVVFDWDGTVVDSAAQIVTAMRRSIEDAGLPSRTDAQMRHIIGLGLREAIIALYPDLDIDVDAMINFYRQHWRAHDSGPAVPFAGIVDLIADLRSAGVFTAVATGKSRAGLDRGLDETGLRTQFEITRCADECFSKPHPQMMEEILAYTGVHAREAVMIGDTTYDLDMARNAGTRGIGVSYGAHPVDCLLESEPLAIVDDVAALRQQLLVGN